MDQPFSNAWLLNVYKLAYQHSTATPPPQQQERIKPKAPASFLQSPAGSTTCHTGTSPNNDTAAISDAHDNLLDSFPSPPPPSTSQTAATVGLMTSMKVRLSNLTSSRDSLIATCADLTSENQSLRWNSAEMAARVKELGDDLAQERRGAALHEKEWAGEKEEMCRKFDGATQADKNMITSLLEMRTENLGRVRDLENKLNEVESFCKTGEGRDNLRMEATLAETKLRLALAQAERDELEVAVLERSGSEAGSVGGGSVSGGSDYWEWKGSSSGRKGKEGGRSRKVLGEINR